MYAPTFKCKEKLFTKVKPTVREIDILYSQSTMNTMDIFMSIAYNIVQIIPT
jgi:hypothetical protein